MKVEKIACDVCKEVYEATEPMLKVVINVRKPELSAHSSPKVDMDVCVAKCAARVASALRVEPSALT